MLSDDGNLFGFKLFGDAMSFTVFGELCFELDQHGLGTYQLFSGVEQIAFSKQVTLWFFCISNFWSIEEFTSPIALKHPIYTIPKSIKHHFPNYLKGSICLEWPDGTPKGRDTYIHQGLRRILYLLDGQPECLGKIIVHLLATALCGITPSLYQPDWQGHMLECDSHVKAVENVITKDMVRMVFDHHRETNDI